MPETRSKTAQQSSNGDTDQQQSSAGTTEGSSATTTTTTTTTTTEGNTDCTTTTDTSTEKQSETPQAQTDEPVPVAPTDSADAPRPSEKRKSTCNSRKSNSKRVHRIAKAKEELLRAQVQLAAARLAALETEETDSEEDDNTVVQDQEAQKRVGNWVDTQMETLATIDAPHQENGTTGQNSKIQTSSRPLPRPTCHLQFARPRHVPRPKPNRRNRQKSRQQCTQQKPRLHSILDLNTSLLSPGSIPCRLRPRGGVLEAADFRKSLF
ncbi:hypothetical protein EVAR_98432_1 [Eumeta japonica]|uniref:Uncharacterized protein n=1 Tax=Eumeta variegata TaxID=151549 RepID=A0A4C2A0S5_EUMVA|nr:hypothetical protein EVAR_98432_1 [Eumeta japonica]